MAMTTGGSGGYSSEINVTPLVDVCLVLLIIFMVVTPLTQMGYDVEIPKESKVQIPVNDKTQVILAINQQGCAMTAPLGGKPLPTGCTVLLNQIPITVPELPGKIKDLYKNRPDKVLFLAAEESLNYEGVMQVVDLAKGAQEGLQIGIVKEEGLAMPGGGAASPAL